MTTGSWFILFKADQCFHCAKVKPIFEQLSEEQELAERGIVLATMDVPSNRKTATRLDIRGFPLLLYFHRGHLFRFRGKRTLESFKKFLLEDVDSMMGGAIPPPMSSIEVFLRELTAACKDFYDAAMGHGGVVGMSLAALTVMFFLLLATLIAMCFWPSSITEHEKVH